MTKGGIAPNQRRRVIELAKSGEVTSLRALERALAAEGVKLSHVSCGAILEAAGIAIAKGPRVPSGAKGARVAAKPAKGPRRAKAVEPDDEPSPESAPGQADPEVMDDVLEADRAFVEGALAMKLPEMPPLPSDAPPDALQAWCNLMDARSLLAALRPKLLTGDVSYANFKAALDSSIKAADALAARMPKAEPDPSKDPTNLAAREMVRATVRRVVGAVELRAGRVCARCGEGLE